MQDGLYLGRPRCTFAFRPEESSESPKEQRYWNNDIKKSSPRSPPSVCPLVRISSNAVSRHTRVICDFVFSSTRFRNPPVSLCLFLFHARAPARFHVGNPTLLVCYPDTTNTDASSRVAFHGIIVYVVVAADATAESHESPTTENFCRVSGIPEFSADCCSR